MVMACVTAAFADEATFDFTNPTGLTPAVTPSEEASKGVAVGDMTFAANGVAVSFVLQEGANPTCIWTGTAAKDYAKELRVYKNSSLVITAPEGKPISKIVFDGAAVGDALLVPDAGTYASKNWGGSAEKVTFTVTATTKINSIVVTFDGEGGGGETPVDPTPDPTPDPDEAAVLFSEAFASGIGTFTIDDKTLPEGSTYVWAFDSKYKCMKASAFVGEAKKVSESWLVSPVIDLTEATECTLAFAHAANHFADLAAEIKVMVKAEDGEWTAVVPSAYPTNFTFVDATADLSAYDGKKIQVAFVYTSTTESACTYEVKDFAVKGKGKAVVEQPEVPDYTSIAALKAAATATEVPVTYTFSDLLVTGIAKKGANYSVYVTDGTEGMQFFGTNEPAFAKGDKLSGKVAGSLVSFRTLTEISGADYTEVTVASSGNEVVPVAASLVDVKNNETKTYENLFVRLEGVSFAAEALENSNITMLDDSDNELTLRDNFGVLSDFIFDVTKTYDVTAVVVYYNGTPQLYPLSAADVKMITNLQDAATAWASDEVAILAGEEWTVNNTLTTATDGAKTFTSSDENVAMVAENGTVTVKGYGHTIITVETVETETYLASKASYDLYVIEGKGTLAEPYSIADAMYFNGKVTDKVWVKGEISGYYDSKSQYAAGTEGAQASNLAIGTAEQNLPVQLQSKTDIRTDLNLVDHPENLNRVVWLYGNIDTYFKVTGLKNVTDYSFDGEQTVTGIGNVETATDNAAVVYGLDGRRVQQPARGLYIVNGKKVFMK